MQSTAHIEAPVEKVFDFFLDPRKSADLSPVGTEIREVKMTEEGTGSYFSWRAKMAGVPLEGFDVYTDVVPNKHISEKSSSAMVGDWDYSFEPEGTGTRVTMEHRGRSLWRMPVLSNMMDLATSRMSESFMRRVKDRVETSST
ncbi:MAG: SRPBCC family protein [Nocardioides sp.]